MNAKRIHLAFVLSVGLVAAGYGLSLARSASYAAGGADSSGYLNLARTILQWEPVQPVRELGILGLGDDFRSAFIPLGYLPGPRPATMSPYYPPGLSLHMAFAAVLFGWDRGPFWVAPIGAAICCFLVVLLGRDLGLRRWPAVAAATILSVNADFVFQALQPMSDVPATCWTLAAILCARRSRSDFRYAAGAGFAFGVAALVRPTSVLLLPALLIFLGLDLRRLVAFVLGGLPSFFFFAAYDLTAFGRPLRTGYGEAGLGYAFAWNNFLPRFRHYSRWLSAMLTFAIPAGWLAYLVHRKAPFRDRTAVGAWFLAFFVFYCFYGPYDSWIFLRFLLPGMPALILGAVVRAQSIADRFCERYPPAWHMRAAFALSLLAVIFLDARQIRTLQVRDIITDEYRYPAACAWANRNLPAGAFLVTMQLSGALRYYTNFPNLNWQQVQADKGRTLLEAIARTGRPAFALLFPFEEPELSKRLPAHWTRIGNLKDVNLWKLAG